MRAEHVLEVVSLSSHITDVKYKLLLKFGIVLDILISLILGYSYSDMISSFNSEHEYWLFIVIHIVLVCLLCICMHGVWLSYARRIKSIWPKLVSIRSNFILSHLHPKRLHQKNVSISLCSIAYHIFFLS